MVKKDILTETVKRAVLNRLIITGPDDELQRYMVTNFGQESLKAPAPDNIPIIEFPSDKLISGGSTWEFSMVARSPVALVFECTHTGRCTLPVDRDIAHDWPNLRVELQSWALEGWDACYSVGESSNPTQPDFSTPFNGDLRENNGLLVTWVPQCSQGEKEAIARGYDNLFYHVSKFYGKKCALNFPEEWQHNPPPPDQRTKLFLAYYKKTKRRSRK
jgi:hypothetical protein